MAAADYYLCDVCDSKCFYDANLNYETPDRNGNDSWGHTLQPDELVRGRSYKLDYLGDIAAVCRDCAKTHEVLVRPIAARGLLAALETLVLFTKPTKSNAVALHAAQEAIAKARSAPK